MYNGTNHFGIAHQEELYRVAAKGGEQHFEERRPRKSSEERLLRGLFGRIFNRKKKQETASPLSLREPHTFLK
jgi:hypothetical protein